MIRARVSGGSIWLVTENAIGVIDQPKKEKENVGAVVHGGKLTIKNVTFGTSDPPFCMATEPRLLRTVWALNPAALPYAKRCLSAAATLHRAAQGFVTSVREFTRDA